VSTVDPKVVSVVREDKDGGQRLCILPMRFRSGHGDRPSKFGDELEFTELVDDAFRLTSSGEVKVENLVEVDESVSKGVPPKT
jgi:hypothetical protein